jgi:hypothetical protein
MDWWAKLCISISVVKGQAKDMRKGYALFISTKADALCKQMFRLKIKDD